ncbi:thioesterase [Streptomyces sp. ET3-23]|uniref:thioesterase II family protein n=1 Tax=Streptomyces sp. ET3-23 TaxID=2885643 RepID=UPI001D0FE72D|nr:thioesterase domain-containing protein [Streptomyces sp. ET3-23]MCC2275216.1 thioesterase [Streptomyces sp. ET3-23]
MAASTHDSPVFASDNSGSIPAIICLLHHAGGSSALYANWRSLFPPSWVIKCLELPGRACSDHLADSFFTPKHFARHLLREVPHAEMPLAIFGHSLGAMVACELTSYLAEENNPPAWLGISACSAPGLLPKPNPIHLLPDQKLQSALRQIGGTPEEALDDPEIWHTFGPTMRRDIESGETWPGPSARVNVPFSLFGGRDDWLSPPSTLHGWERHLGPCQGIRIYPGGHFYLNAWASVLAQQIMLDLITSQG